MKQPHRKNVPLLKWIPLHPFSSQQKAFRPTSPDDDDASLIYQLLREPTHLHEFARHATKQQSEISIWRDNETVLCIGEKGNERYIRNESFALYVPILDAAIAETAVFFWSLPYTGNTYYNCLEIYSSRTYDDDDDSKFNFAALQPEQLARILDANPTRILELISGTWTTEQSVVLATRPYPLSLRLMGPSWVWKHYPMEEYGGFSFEDKGAAFVDALETRQSSFGWLYVDIKPECFAFSSENFERLLKLDVIEKLSFSVLDEPFVLLPFFARANTLEYTMDGCDILPQDFESLDIVPKDLCVTLSLEYEQDWVDHMISLLNRVADLGHFEKLSIGLDDFGDLDDGIDESPVVPALIRAIRANPNLACLDLSGTGFMLDQAPYLEHLFQAVEEHESLRTLILYEYPSEYYSEGDDPDRPCQPGYFVLERLLSRNRNITVLDYYGNRCTDGHGIDRLYLLNGFYNGSLTLVKESAAVRPLLVATALTINASGDFQFAALLLFNHTDMLCEFVEGVDLDDIDVAGTVTHDTLASTSHASHQTTDRSKRRRVFEQPEL